MSYRTYINGHEWLGNNEMHEEIYEELKRQGCPFDEDGCVHDFEVKDLDGLVKACEKAVIRMVHENRKIADFADTIDNAIERNMGLTYRLQQLNNYAYIFIGVKLLDYIGEWNKQWETCWRKTEDGKLEDVYRLRGDGKCIFSAY